MGSFVNGLVQCNLDPQRLVKATMTKKNTI